MIPAHLRREAAFHRAALLLGLEAGPTTVQWAETALARLDLAPAELIDVAMTPATDLSALRHALALVEDPEPEGLAPALLDRAARDLRDGRRSMPDTFTLLGQLRRNFGLAHEVGARLARLENGFLVARARIERSEAEIGAELGEWLDQFTGAEEAYFAGPVDHVLELPADQAAAFVAALSRYLASPAAVHGSDPALVWSEAGPSEARLYLNPAAWAAASAAFSPLPDAARQSADLRPPRARMVLDSRRREALGRDQVVLT